MGNFNQLRKLKNANPGLKVLVSVRGWSGTSHFSDAAASPDSRRTLVQSCIDMLLAGDLPFDGSAGGRGAAAGLFDGIDIDWEYPVRHGDTGKVERPEDKLNATLLFREFRRQLDEREARTGRHYLLTAAIPSGDYLATLSYELEKVAEALSWMNMMTYDVHGPWNEYTAFNSPFVTDPLAPILRQGKPSPGVTETVDFFLTQGVLPSKIVIGVPFYARQYVCVPDVGHGLYQRFDNTCLDGTSWELADAPAYRDLVDVGQIVTPGSAGDPPHGRNGFERHWSKATREPWLYNPGAMRAGKRVASFITYEDPASLSQRVEYIRERGLRGAMIWEISQDSDARDLTRTLGRLR
jgi:chitinase